MIGLCLKALHHIFPFSSARSIHQHSHRHLKKAKVLVPFFFSFSFSFLFNTKLHLDEIVWARQKNTAFGLLLFPFVNTRRVMEASAYTNWSWGHTGVVQFFSFSSLSVF